MILPPQKFSLPFLKKELLAHDTYALFFDRRGSNFTFLPGQYVRISLIPESEDPRGNHRSFSVCSSPTDHDTLMIVTHGKEIQSPYKRKMLSLKKSEEVTFWGPMGIFTLPEETTREIVLLAGGVGIAPFYSMLTSLTKNNNSQKITLIASFRKQEQVVFLEQLTKHTLDIPEVEIMYTVTQHNEKNTMWQGEKERISEVLLKKYISSPENALFYICGSVAMVEGMTETLLAMNIPLEQIQRELFTGY